MPRQESVAIRAGMAKAVTRYELLLVFRRARPALLPLGKPDWRIATIIFTNRRERARQEQERLLAQDRQKHERMLKEIELDEVRAARKPGNKLATLGSATS
jgi:hypothetical protein